MKSQPEARGAWMNIMSSREIKTNIFSNVFHLPPFRFYSEHLWDCKKQHESSTRMGCSWLYQPPHISSVRHYILSSGLTPAGSSTIAPHCKAPLCRNPHLSPSTPRSWPEELLPHGKPTTASWLLYFFLKYLLFEKNLPLLVPST